MSKRVSNWNVANALTVLRILIVPLFAYLLLIRREVFLHKKV